MQNKNRTVFIPDSLTNKIFHHTSTKACSPIWNISHIVSSRLHCGRQRNDP